MADAEAAASAAMHRWAADVTARHETMRATDRAHLDRWIERRADALCGPQPIATTDLFGDAPSVPAWRFAATPFERLAAFAADRTNSAADRRAAEDAAACFERRLREAPALLPPILHRTGLLMLVPAP